MSVNTRSAAHGSRVWERALLDHAEAAFVSLREEREASSKILRKETAQQEARLESLQSAFLEHVTRKQAEVDSLEVKVAELERRLKEKDETIRVLRGEADAPEEPCVDLVCSDSSTGTLKRKRGRPPGSTKKTPFPDRPQVDFLRGKMFVDLEKKRRGRPPGSTKKTPVPDTPQVDFLHGTMSTGSQKRGPGRPPGSKKTMRIPDSPYADLLHRAVSSGSQNKQPERPMGSTPGTLKNQAESRSWYAALWNHLTPEGSEKRPLANHPTKSDLSSQTPTTHRSPPLTNGVITPPSSSNSPIEKVTASSDIESDFDDLISKPRKRLKTSENHTGSSQREAESESEYKHAGSSQSEQESESEYEP